MLHHEFPEYLYWKHVYNKIYRVIYSFTPTSINTSWIPKSRKLHKIFNRIIIKFSYSCIENMLQKEKWKKKQLKNYSMQQTSITCNCKSKCPVNVIQQFTVISKYGCSITLSKCTWNLLNTKKTKNNLKNKKYSISLLPQKESTSFPNTSRETNSYSTTFNHID